MNSSPQAPGRLGIAATAAEMLTYLGQLDSWLAQRRAELDTLDSQVISTNRQAELTADISLAMALWQAAKTRQNLLLATWDSGRVGQQELERLSALIWGRLDTASAQVASLQSMAVSLPEAGRLSDALVSQLRTRLNTDPNATALAMRQRDLRAQIERIRDQLRLEPPALVPPSEAKLAGLVNRLDQLSDKGARGGDITGLVSTLEIEAAKLERDLIVGAARRREGRDLLTKVREQHTRVSAHAAAVQSLAERAAAAVWPAPLEQPLQVETLGPIPNTATALATYQAALTAMEGQLGTIQGRLSQALAERDAAVGQFSAIQAKAASLGVGGDPELVELGAIIGSKLDATPVVLPTVRPLLAAYAAELEYLAKKGRR